MNYFDIHSNGMCSELTEFMCNEYENSLGMYDFLYNFGQFLSNSQPGLGSLNRSQSSCNNGGMNRFDFEGHSEALIKLFKKASAPVRSIIESKQNFNDLLSSIAKLCHGVDNMLGLQLVQLSAMFGLLPAVFCKFATLTGKNATSRGSNQLIQLCTSNSGNEKCADDADTQNSIFNGLCAEISNVMVTIMEDFLDTHLQNWKLQCVRSGEF